MRIFARIKPRLAEYVMGERIEAWTQEHIGPISQVDTKEPVVSLTFDDGPHPVFTPRLLEVLAKHDARATFFMLGDMARRYPDIVRAAAEQGHAIGNHTYDHVSVPLVSRKELKRQIKECSRTLAPSEQKLFRPPYGQRSIRSCIDAAALGYEIIAWNVHAFDWLDHDAEWMADHMESHVGPGSIVALHDALYHVMENAYADRMPTVEAVNLLLGRAKGKYRFVTVPELMRHGSVRRQSCAGRVDREFLKTLKPNDGPVHTYEESAIAS